MSIELARILLVDDSRFNLNALHSLLRDEYKIMAAIHAEQAFAAIEKNRPDLILLDVNMPDMDGYQICSVLKSDPATWDIPVAFVTGSGDADDIKRGLAAGACEFLIKPFNPELLKLRVKNILAVERMRAQLQLYQTRFGEE